MKRSRWRHLRNKWVVISLIAVVVIGGIVLAKSGPKTPGFDSVAVTKSDIIQLVSVTGTISPFDKADLAFQKGGVVSEILVKVGDKVSRGQVLARLESSADMAALASANATLADMSRSLSPEEMAVQETLIDNARRDAVNASQTALVRAQGAVFNSADTLFSNPQSANPTISVRTYSWQQETAVNNQRVAVAAVLNKWTMDMASASSADAADILARARGYLATIGSFLDQLSAIVNDLNPSNSGLTQSQISEHVTTMNTALTALNSATDTVTASSAALAAAQTNYQLKLSGNSSQSIAAQAARVAQSRAALEQSTLVSPIDGVVTKVLPSVGEFIGAGQSGFTVQNDLFKVEAYVAESDIAKVSVGHMASTTLDAYGSDVDFPSQVIAIDPAETMIEGVPTYKVTLVFLSSDDRIRSGMTANLDIVTAVRLDVLSVPYRAVIDEANSRVVRLVGSDGLSYSTVPVMTGLRGSSGTVEILSGVSEGDKVVTYVK